MIILAVVIVVLAAVAWVVPGFVEGYRGGYQEGLLIGIHDSCVSSATDAAQARRLDVGTPEFTRKIAGGGSDGREGAAGHRELPALRTCERIGQELRLEPYPSTSLRMRGAFQWYLSTSRLVLSEVEGHSGGTISIPSHALT